MAKILEKFDTSHVHACRVYRNYATSLKKLHAKTSNGNVNKCYCLPNQISEISPKQLDQEKILELLTTMHDTLRGPHHIRQSKGNRNFLTGIGKAIGATLHGVGEGETP